MIAEEKLLANGYDIENCDLGANRPRELESIAGNGMHCRAFACALTMCLAASNKRKLMDEVKHFHKGTKKRKPTKTH